MTIRIIAPGREVQGASANGNGVGVSIDGHHFVVDANPGDNIQLQLNNGSVDLPPANDDDRRRGWRRLNANNALAYGVDDDKVVVLPACGMNDWMSGLPDDRALADITIPGSHESASLHGGGWQRRGLKADKQVSSPSARTTTSGSSSSMVFASSTSVSRRMATSFRVSGWSMGFWKLGVHWVTSLLRLVACCPGV